MSVDVATLVFDFKSDSAANAEKAMDQLIAKGEQLEATAKRVRTATDRMNDGHQGAAATSKVATQGAMAYAQAEGAVEKATRSSATASAATRQARALEAAAMRELVQATKAYERDQIAAAKAQSAAVRQAAAGAKAAAAEEASAARQRAREVQESRALEAAAMRELVVAAKAYERDQAAAASQAARAQASSDRAAEQSAAQVLAFRVRMSKQRAAEEAGAARQAQAAQEAADRAAERSAQQVLAFRARMAKQRAAEEASAAHEQASAVTQLEARIAALKGAIDPTWAAQRRLDGEMKEAAALYKLGAISATDYAARVAQLDAQAAAAARGQTLLSGAMAGGARNAKGLQFAALDLSRQFADIGVTAAMGMNPLMILIQQGPQIADRLALMKMEGIGLGAALRALAGSMAPLLIALTPLAILAGAAAAGFGLLNHEISKAYPKDITKGLGLTEEQLARVKDKTVTLGDTFKATLDVMGKYLMSGPLGDGFKWLAKAWNDTLDLLTKAAFEGTARLIGLFVGAYRTIANNWRNFPAVMADVFALAVNAGVDGMQKLVNVSIKALNTAKAAASVLNPALTLIPNVPEVDLSKFKMGVSGAFEFIQKSAAANVAQATEEVRSGLRKIETDIKAAALKIARDRALKQAGDPAATRDHKDKEELDAFTLAAKAFNKEMERRNELAREWEHLIRQTKFVNPDLDQALWDSDRAQEAADQMAALADSARSLGDSLADGFGRAGNALATLLDGMARFRASEAAIKAQQASSFAEMAKARDAFAKGDQTANARAEMARAEARYNADRVKNAEALGRIETERNLSEIEGVKSLLSQKSAAYKVLTGLEVALQAVQIAGQIKTLAMDAILTAKSIANAVARGAAKGAEAVANALASVPFPFNLAAAAATVAALVAVGIRLVGGGHSGGGSVPSADERQKTQGTGTVLGDAAAKSASIAHAIDLVAKNTNKDLEYSNGMLRALRSIDDNIGSLTGLLSQQLGVGGAFDTSKAGLGTKRGVDTTGLLVGLGPIGLALSQIPIIGGIIKSLFGTKKTTTLLDQGVTFDPQSLDAITNGGLAGDSYQDIQTKKKKKFFGITYSNKTSTSTQATPLQDDILAEMQRVIGSLRDGVLAAAGALGVEGADAALKAFTVDLGTISFKDKTGEEIQDELNAVFSKLGDQLSEAVLPSIKELQRAGEGAFETLVRVAREYQVVDVTLQAMGKTFGAVGVASLAARDDLVKLFGSLDDFVQASQFFTENFLSEAEQMAPIQAAVVKEFQRLGVTGVNTKEQFKQLVLGLDLTTQAGRDMYAALLAVAPAFAKVFDYLNPDAAKDAVKSLSDLRQDLTDAYERESSALQDTIDKFREFSDSLKAFRKSLDTGPNALLSPEAQYQATKAAFNDTAAKAKLGDPQALQDLQNVSQAYLDASKSYYASSGGYFKDLADVKAAVEAAGATAGRAADNAQTQLDVMKQQVAGLIDINQNVISVHDAIVALQTALSAQSAGGIAAPFSPTTSATGSTAPGYTYTSPVPTTPATGGPAVTPIAPGPMQPATWTQYVEQNRDLLALFQSGTGMARGRTEDEFGLYHFQRYGKSEGRLGVPGFASGGAFLNGVVSHPTAFNMAQMGEAGPEGILPLTNVGGKLGVHATRGSNDNSEVVTELRAMREDNKQLRIEVVALQRVVAKSGEVQASAHLQGATKIVKTLEDGGGKTQRLVRGG